MSTFVSWPVEEVNLSSDQWKYTTLPQGSGIIDRGGKPWYLTGMGSDSETNRLNQMKLTVSSTTGTAEAIVSGFFIRMSDGDHVVDLPAVSTATTYYIGVEYDPLMQRDKVTGPVQVKVYAGTIDREQGKIFIPLWDVTRRANELLSDATVVRRRPKVAPIVNFDYPEEMPDTPYGYLWGTLAMTTNTNGEPGAMWRAGGIGTAEDGWPNVWVKVKDSYKIDWIYREDNSTYRWNGVGIRPRNGLLNGLVYIQGYIERTNGEPFQAASSTGYYLMNLPVGRRPPSTLSFPVIGSGYADPAHGRIDIFAANGEVRLWVNKDTPWVSMAIPPFPAEQ